MTEKERGFSTPYDAQIPKAAFAAREVVMNTFANIDRDERLKIGTLAYFLGIICAVSRREGCTILAFDRLASFLEDEDGLSRQALAWVVRTVAQSVERAEITKSK